jgi:hypothetical protein
VLHGRPLGEPDEASRPELPGMGLQHSLNLITCGEARAGRDGLVAGRVVAGQWNRRRGQRCLGLAAGGDAEIDGPAVVGALVDLGELVAGSGEADLRPSTSPSQPSRSASEIRVRRLSRISTSRWRCSGSGHSIGQRTSRARGCRRWRRSTRRCPGIPYGARNGRGTRAIPARWGAVFLGGA